MIVRMAVLGRRGVAAARTEAVLDLALDGGADDGELKGLFDQLLPRDADLGAHIGGILDEGAKAVRGALLGHRGSRHQWVQRLYGTLGIP